MDRPKNYLDEEIFFSGLCGDFDEMIGEWDAYRRRQYFSFVSPFWFHVSVLNYDLFSSGFNRYFLKTEYFN